MVNKVVLGLIVLVAVIDGVAGGVLQGYGGLLLVILGLVLGYLLGDEDRQNLYLAAIAAALAGNGNVLEGLNIIAGIGTHLDGILDGLVVGGLSAVVTVVVVSLVAKLSE